MSDRYLPGSEKYRNNGRQKRKHVAKGSPIDLIQRANRVSIYNVLRDFLDLHVPEGGNSYKVRCPFYYEHADGGLDKGYRVYGESNSSYCFVLHGVMTPVTLVALSKDMRPTAAAQQILQHYDLLKAKRYDLRFAELLAERSESMTAKTTPSYAVEALQTALRRHPAYADKQFDADFLDAMEDELNNLDDAVEREVDVNDSVSMWFNQAKERLTAML